MHNYFQTKKGISIIKQQISENVEILQSIWHKINVQIVLFLDSRQEKQQHFHIVVQHKKISQLGELHNPEATYVRPTKEVYLFLFIFPFWRELHFDINIG